ncbi:MAG TPA: hypothetical protein VN931_03490 [Fibrobacteria bacterium]|nr:hypothetical protein [Fibrobacteria bacterium]
MFPVFLALSICSALPTQILHLRADSGVVLDGAGHVKLWKDLSPRHADFGTSSLGKPQRIFLTSFHDTAEKRIYDTLSSDSLVRPRWVLNGINGLPAVAFDGGQVLVDTTSLPLDSGFTLFIVAQDSTPLGSSATLVDKGEGDFNTDLPDSSGGGINGNFNMGIAWIQDIASTNFRTAAPTLYESNWDGSTGRLWTNGILRDTGTWTGSVARAKSTWMGGVINPYGVLQNFLEGRIAEVVAYAGSLDSSDRQAIEDSLMAEYLPKPPASERPVEILHLRADSGVVLDGTGRVKLWKDLSPRHTDFGTSNLGKPQLLFVTANSDSVDRRVYQTLDSDSLLRPRLVQDGIGGLPAVAFDGAQVLCNSSSLPLDSGFTLFVLAQDSSGPGRTAAVFDKGEGDFNSDHPDGWAGGVDGSFNISVSWVQNIANSPFETMAPALYESAWNGDTGTLWANGRFLVAGTYEGPVQRNQTTWLGAVLNPYSELQSFMHGRIAEVVVWAGALTGWQRQIAENALLAKYGIQRSTASLSPATAPGGFSVHFGSGRIQIASTGEGRVYATNLNGRILGQAELVSGKAELPRYHGEVLLTVRHASGNVQSRLLVDPSR